MIVRVAEDVASYLNNKKRRELTRIEEDEQLSVHIQGGEAFEPEFLEMECYDADGNEVPFPTD